MIWRSLIDIEATRTNVRRPSVLPQKSEKVGRLRQLRFHAGQVESKRIAQLFLRLEANIQIERLFKHQLEPVKAGPSDLFNYLLCESDTSGHGRRGLRPPTWCGTRGAVI